MNKVFISYRRADSATLATLIAKSLAGAAIDAYVDTRSSDAGGLFPDRLRQAIENCDVFVCLLGRTTLESEWVLNEIEHAHNLRKPMIPVFQEGFDTTQPPPNEDAAALLRYDGVHILDIKNLYVDEALAGLEQMIRNTAQRSDAPGTPAAQARVSARRLPAWLIPLLVVLIGAVGTIIAALISAGGGQPTALLPTSTTAVPTLEATTLVPTAVQTQEPSATPSPSPTETPSITPTATASRVPTEAPTGTATPAPQGVHQAAICQVSVRSPHNPALTDAPVYSSHTTTSVLRMLAIGTTVLITDPPREFRGTTRYSIQASSDRSFLGWIDSQYVPDALDCE